MKEIISLTPFLSNPVDIYIPHRSFLHPRNPALCVSVTHIPIDYLSTIALHHRGALYVRLLIRIRQHEIEGGRAWKGMIEMIAARAPTRFQGLTTTPSFLRFGDKPSFLSANSKHWSLSRPPSIVLPLPPLFASVWNVVPLPCEGESDRECIGSLPPTIGRARSCYIDRLDFIPPPPDPITLNNLSANYKR